MAAIVSFMVEGVTMKKYTLISLVIVTFLGGATFLYLILAMFNYNLHEYSNQHVIRDAAPNVVKIEHLSRRMGGTGFYLNIPAGRVLITNKHVCEGSESMQIVDKDNKDLEVVPVLKRAPKADLCMLAPGSKAQHGLFLGSKPEAYDKASSTGFPFLENLTTTEGRLALAQEIVTGGPIPASVEAINDCLSNGNFVDYSLFGVLCFTKRVMYHSSLRVYPGCSGSPVLNSSGGVIGVAAATQGGSSYAAIVTWDDLREFINE